MTSGTRCAISARLLPHEIAPYIDGQMDQAALAVRKAFRTAPASA
jgi:hypothetical protein